MAHKGKATSDVSFNLEDPPEAYTNPSVHSRISEYTEVARTPTNDASGPSPQSQCPRWVHVVFFSFVVHLVMDLWYTCDALMDFDRLVDLFEWTYYYICDIYCDGCNMCGWMYRWMRYICDEWDIYVMDEIYIYMWYMFVWIYLSRWNIKKIKNCCFGSLCRVLHSAKDPLPSAMVTALGKAGKIGAQKTIFQLCGVPWHSAKNFFLKNSNFAECRPEGTWQRIFF